MEIETWLEGIEHEPLAWNTKNFTSTLQQKHTFHLYGIESPDLCTVTRSVTLPQECFTPNWIIERRFSSYIFILFLVKETAFKIFVVSFQTLYITFCVKFSIPDNSF
jgi:hypothetical protein